MLRHSTTWACCYSNGDGVAKDAEQAVSWFRLAADAGHAERAVSSLGVLLLARVTGLRRMQSRPHNGSALQQRLDTQVRSSTWAVCYS